MKMMKEHSTGATNTIAASRGVTSRCTGLMPMTRSASTSSRMVRAPRSVATAEPAAPPSNSAAKGWQGEFGWVADVSGGFAKDRDDPGARGPRRDSVRARLAVFWFVGRPHHLTDRMPAAGGGAHIGVDTGESGAFGLTGWYS